MSWTTEYWERVYRYKGFKRKDFVDLEGNVVERNPIDYHYSYSPYVIWKENYSTSDKLVYSDRLFQWDREQYDKSYQKAFGRSSGYRFDDYRYNYIEKFLCLYFDKKIKLTAILEGCNVGNGYPYWMFFYREC